MCINKLFLWRLREEAYAIVQDNAMKVWDDIQKAQSGKTYRELLEEDNRCTLTAEQLDTIFNPWEFLRRKDVLFERLEGLTF